jgi:hypothetical protein
MQSICTPAACFPRFLHLSGLQLQVASQQARVHTNNAHALHEEIIVHIMTCICFTVQVTHVPCLGMLYGASHLIMQICVGDRWSWRSKTEMVHVLPFGWARFMTICSRTHFSDWNAWPQCSSSLSWLRCIHIWKPLALVSATGPLIV